MVIRILPQRGRCICPDEEQEIVLFSWIDQAMYYLDSVLASGQDTGGREQSSCRIYAFKEWL